MNEQQSLKYIYQQFSAQGTYQTGEIFGSGHINDTYLVKTLESNLPDYILRRINHYVFRDVPGLLENIALVTQHIRREKQAYDLHDSGLEYILTLIPALSGEYYVLDEKGEYWCLLYYIPDSKSLDVVENSDQAAEGGRAFGNFIRYLSTFPVDRLNITIPHFHDVEKRLETFRQVVKEISEIEFKQTEKMISFVEERAENMCTIGRAGKKGLLPLRVTHNDTKFNNVLLNHSDRAICVIDLDTVMPGYVHYDFGDALRTITNNGKEDDKDLDNVNFNYSYFKAFTRGFLDTALPILTEKEKKLLPLAPFMMTYIMGLRFLTDYLQGDIYYKTDYPGHNLQRARAQFKLYSSMEQAENDIWSYIYSFMQ